MHRRIKRDLLCHRQLDFTTVIFLNDRPLCFFRQLIKPATDKHCLLPILDLMNYYIPDRQIHGVEFLFKIIFQWTVCLFVFVNTFFRRKLGIPIGILPMSGAGVNGNAPYQGILGYKQTFYLLGRFNPNTT